MRRKSLPVAPGEKGVLPTPQSIYLQGKRGICYDFSVK